MLNIQRLRDILDLLVKKGVIHAGQRQDVLNRGRDQARHILLDKRAEMGDCSDSLAWPTG